NCLLLLHPVVCVGFLGQWSGGGLSLGGPAEISQQTPAQAPPGPTGSNSYRLSLLRMRDKKSSWKPERMSWDWMGILPSSQI
ncbi:hypothetical protein LEMLEM_LOCUS5073, partial [Lemmus lemmus]